MLRGAARSAWAPTQHGRRRPRGLSSCAVHSDRYHPPVLPSLRLGFHKPSLISRHDSGSARGLSSFLQFMQERESPAAISGSDEDERPKSGSARDQASLLEPMQERNARVAIPPSINDEQLSMGIVPGRPSLLEFMVERNSPAAIPLSYRDERANTRYDMGVALLLTGGEDVNCLTILVGTKVALERRKAGPRVGMKCSGSGQADILPPSRILPTPAYVATRNHPLAPHKVLISGVEISPTTGFRLRYNYHLHRPSDIRDNRHLRISYCLP